MRWMGMPMAMWTVFVKSFQTQLAVLGYDADAAREITEKAKPKYREIIAKLPEFEKGDRFSMNIIGCAMLGAFILSMPRRPDVERLTAYYEKAQMTPLPDRIDVPGTEIHIFYALKMGEKYRARYEQHFARPIIHEQDMRHEELLACCPEQWAALVKSIMEGKQ